ncbi:hypothetical protein H2198_002790 [Neophaeococcomyces mojaviensis]|uniref:Uncharacterized protein n=1 Tax=Neophaeococcomyces mojaviensis TaxID=3383035 RepID=A0ACC3ADH6_9EURO|nr:hypothetical protein H2198_002790 [Knufia sp. JES_112]
MASLPSEEKTEFLLAILASVDEFKPNYTVVAERLGINTAHNAQRKFKSIVEADKKFTLQSGKDSVRLIGKDSADGQPTTPAKSTQTAKAKTPKSNKRGKTDDEGESEKGSNSPKKKKLKKSTKEIEADDVEMEGGNENEA